MSGKQLITMYLKSQKVDLSRGNVGSTSGHREAAHIVGVSVQELLFVITDAPQNHSASQRIDEVLFVWMESQA